VTPRMPKAPRPTRNTRSPRPAPRGRARAAKTPGRRPGRPSKLSPDAVAQLEQLVRAGTTIDVAAAFVGVSRGTFYRWLKQGENARAGTVARDLHDRVARARAESESVLVARIGQAAAKGSWQAAAWLLERRFPERWMKPTERPLPEAPAAPDAGDERDFDKDPFADVIELAKRRRQ
jgi:Helix-turn-helix domain of resolvase